MRKLLLATNLLLLLALTAAGQGIVNGNVANPIPPSPSAASLGTYGDVPVDLSSGQVSIALPVFEVGKGTKIGYPVSLTYNGAGIKVSEIAPWTGANWNMSYGGIINRQVKGGFPDELTSIGFYAMPYGTTNAHRMSQFDAPLNTATDGSFAISIEDQDFIDALTAGAYDTEPDLYTFNFPGGSGSFILVRDSVGTVLDPVLIPSQNIKIVIDNFPDSFTLIDERGVSFEFNEEVSTYKFGSEVHSPYSFNSSWYLSKIVSPYDETETIDYNYQETQLKYLHKFDVSRSYSLAGSTSSPTVVSKDSVEYLTSRIQSIVSPNDSIVFHINPANERLDFAGDYPLDSIQVFDSHGELVKSKVFTYGYYGEQSNNLRLRLDSFYEKAHGLALPGYQFTYNELDPAGYESNSQDYWGYSNGMTNTTLIPSMKISHRRVAVGLDVNGNPQLDYIDPMYGELFDPEVHINISGADRHVDTIHAQAGILKRIVYPTGGHMLIDYENNDINLYAGKAEIHRQFDNYIGKDLHLSNEWESMDVTLDSRLWGIRYDYHERFFGRNNEVKDSTFFLQAFAGEETQFHYVSKDVYIATKQKVDVLGEINGELGPEVITGEIKKVGIEGINGTSYNEYVDQTEFLPQEDGHELFYLSDVLDPGWYRFYAQANTTTDDANKTVSINVEFSVDLGVPLKKRIGGLRVKRISTFSGDEVNPMIRRFKYESNDTTGTSSGSLMNLAAFSYVKYEEANGAHSANHTPILVVTSQPNSGTAGPHNSAYYTRITELIGENGENGKLVHHYIDPYENNTQLIEGPEIIRPEYFPFPYYTDHSWLTGKETIKEIYQINENDSLELVMIEETEYENTYEPDKILGYKYAFFGPHSLSRLPDTKWKRFTMSYTTGYAQPIQVTNTFKNGDVLTTTTTYEYANPAHRKVTLSSTTLSNGAIEKTRTIYPLDSLHLPDAADLISDHIIGQPVESYTWRERGEQKHLLEAQKSTFGGDIMLDSAFVLESANPISFTDESSLLSQIDSLITEAVVINEYDSKGNILSYTKNGQTTCFIWGYNESYPIAKVVNADYDLIRSHDNNLRSLSNADNDSCFDGEGCNEDTLRTGLEQLRNDPALSDAIITTYTYDNLKGITSQTDQNGLTSYYQYDQFGRLVQVMNHHGQLLKTIEYNNQ